MARKPTTYYLVNSPRLATRLEFERYDAENDAYVRVEDISVHPDTHVVFVETVIVNIGTRQLGRTPEDRVITILSHEALHIALRIWDLPHEMKNGTDLVDTVVAVQRHRYHQLGKNGLVSDRWLQQGSRRTRN